MIFLNHLGAVLDKIHAWGRQPPSGLAGIRQPVFVANGDHDRMLPTSNSVDHDEFVDEVLKFLESRPGRRSAGQFLEVPRRGDRAR